MKWIGWILTIFLIITTTMIQRQGAHDLAQAHAEVEAHIASEIDKVNTILDRRSGDVPELQQRLQSEKQRVAELIEQESQLQEQAEKLRLEIATVETSIDSMHSTREQLKDNQQQRMGNIGELQKQIQSIEKDIAVIKSYLPSVASSRGN